MMILNQDAMNTLFFQARSHNAWLDRAVSDEQLHQLFDVMKWAPTSANCSPARLVFVKSAEQKEALLTTLMEGNIEKTRSAPVVAIIGMDMAFYEKLPQLFPHADARAWFVGNPALIEATAFRNSSLQGAYLMLAARAMGLDCGPMSGFDPELVNARFFPNSSVRVNFMCSLGYGDQRGLFDRSPRFEFDEACKIV
jgi:3-hydroxypropanoate dehydrogenase